jgi:hypothetical protein
VILRWLVVILPQWVEHLQWIQQWPVVILPQWAEHLQWTQQWIQQWAEHLRKIPWRLFSP